MSKRICFFRFDEFWRVIARELESVRASLITWKRPRKHLSKNDGNASSIDKKKERTVSLTSIVVGN